MDKIDAMSDKMADGKKWFDMTDADFMDRWMFWNDKYMMWNCEEDKMKVMVRIFFLRNLKIFCNFIVFSICAFIEKHVHYGR